MWVVSFILAGLALGRGIAARIPAAGDDGSQKVLTSGTREQMLHGMDLETVAASIREDTQSPVSCAFCGFLLYKLKQVALRGDDFFIDLMTKLCKTTKAQDPDVCEGSIALEGPIVANSLRGLDIGSHTSRLACVAFMGLCSYPEVRPHNVTFPSPKPKTSRPTPSGLDPIHVVHFSDIHIDPFYVVGANANCSKPICCREYTDADTPGNNAFPAGPNGEHACDAPVSLEESMYAAIQEIVPDAAFSIFTGDIVDHAVWDTSEQQNTVAVRDAYDRMLGADMLVVYGTAGNHEASPANSFPPTAAATANNSSSASQWLYDLLSSAWAPWIGPQAAVATREFGAYAARYSGGGGGDDRGEGRGTLRVISLSTNLYYGHNYWLYEEPMETDPSGQLAWLVRELDAAEMAGERVYIIGHMPMGARDAFHDGSNYFDQIVNRYSATIAAMFFGHTHYDEFQLSYADYANRSHANALAMSYIAPSMTPTSGHPSFRVYDVDPVTFGVLDATTYVANMSDPAFSTGGRPRWTRYYSAREAYGALPGGSVDELTPAFWHNVTVALEANATAFGEFFDRRKRGWDVEDCDEKCRRAEICKLRAARAQDNCVPPGFEFDSLEGGEDGARVRLEKQECEESVVRDTLGAMVLDSNMLSAFEAMVVEEVLHI